MGRFKSSLFLLILFILEITYVVNAEGTDVLKASELISPMPTVTAIPSPTPTPTPYFKPVNFSIPAIGINTNIEYVGADYDGRMGVPQDFNNVGWYRDGFKPGEKGNSVIDGHYDTVTGAPAVFYNLAKLKQGDYIYVTREDGKKIIFQIEDVQTYPFDQVPLVDIISSSDLSKLNLITCEGWFNYKTHNYSHRTVVYSSLVGEE